MYHCTAEWHFRDHNFAGLLHAFALKISKNGGHFYCSGIELARYFGKDKGTIYRAMHKLRSMGFFLLVGQFRDGRKKYFVRTHSQWAKKYPGECWERERQPEVCNELPIDGFESQASQVMSTLEGDGAAIHQG